MERKKGMGNSRKGTLNDESKREALKIWFTPRYPIIGDVGGVNSEVRLIEGGRSRAHLLQWPSSPDQEALSQALEKGKNPSGSIGKICSMSRI